MPAAQKIEEKKTYKITGVEIFSAGTWNGIEHTVGDLHAMVTSFSALKPGWIPSLKLGHDKEQKVARQSGLPSVGWVDKVYVIGDKLYADFDHVPEKVFRLIEKKAYRKVSCEIYYGVEVGDGKYSHVLAAVALLGNEMPGVKNLNDILDQYSHLQTGEVFAILEKQDTFKQYSRHFELSEEAGVSKSEIELKLEQELSQQKANFAALEQEKATLIKDKADFEAFKKELEAKDAKQALELQEQKVKAFVAELKGKKLTTPATETLITELMSNKAEFEIEKEKLTRESALEKLLTLTAEAAKVNFDESSLAEYAKKKDAGDPDGDDDAIKEYMKKNECSYAKAYKEVMKAKKK
jgi:hypothetical protein